MNPYYNREPYGNLFGFAEMYEWANPPEKNNKFLGRLVQFSKENPMLIEFAKTTERLVGITSISSGYIASNPTEWPYKYLFNEYEDLYLKKEDIAIAYKKYDPINEFSYLTTECNQILSPIESPEYDESKEYIKRSNRKEWAIVTLLGNVIAEDNGECVEGEYCTLYKGDDESKFGTLIPATKNSKFKLFVLSRLSENTILVFYTPQIYNFNIYG